MPLVGGRRSVVSIDQCSVGYKVWQSTCLPAGGLQYPLTWPGWWSLVVLSGAQCPGSTEGGIQEIMELTARTCSLTISLGQASLVVLCTPP